jgi:dihydroxyacetone kinase-like protein
MNGPVFVRLIHAINTAMQAAQSELNALDSALGDGDHGGALATAFADAAEKAAALPNPLPSAVLAVTAQSLLNRMGGASGALYGTLFLRMSATCKDRADLNLADWQTALRAGLEGVQSRGKAAPGDKTLVDALAPAVAAISTADTLSSAFAAAAAAAQAGADQTAQMVAKFGRAKFVGERARGHVDAGARSMAVLFAALHHFQEGEDGKA